MKIPSIRDIDVEGKTLIVRVDYNLPLGEKGRVTDNTRIKVTIDTLGYLIKHRAKVVLISHLGRPKSRERHLRMDAVAEELSRLLGRKVKKLDGCVEGFVKKEVSEMEGGEVILLENVRFYEGEKEKDDRKREAFAGKIASMGDIYVNEAFSASHRDHASITGIPKFIPGVLGMLFREEIKAINGITRNPEKPYVAIIGGAKADKISAVKGLLGKVSRILMGGVIGNTFLKARGLEIGGSEYGRELVGDAGKLLGEHEDRIVLPVDAVVDCKGKAEAVSLGEVTKDMKIMDIGPETVAHYSDILGDAKTVIWAGPLGKFEEEPYGKGSLRIAEIISGLSAKTVVGGGDTIAAIRMPEITEKITHVSTGGGAFIDFITENKLPGMEALRDSYRRHGRFFNQNSKK